MIATGARTFFLKGRGNSDGSYSLLRLANKWTKGIEIGCENIPVMQLEYIG